MEADSLSPFELGSPGELRVEAGAAHEDFWSHVGPLGGDTPVVVERFRLAEGR